MVTLDIEDTTIRMMVVKGNRVEAAASLPLEPGLVRNGVIMDAITVSQRITELMASLGVRERNVVACVSGIHSIYRVVNVPKLSKGLLAEAARQELEMAMPVPLNELYTSWQAIPLSDIETALCLVGLPRNTMAAMLQTLKLTGLGSNVMDVRPLALARVTDENNAIVINAGPVSFDIVIMIDGVPELIRSLPFSSDTKPPSDKVAEIKEELDRTVAFYNSSHRGQAIAENTAAFVSGELEVMLAQALEYRVRPLPRLLSYSDELNAGEYVANIGLALKQTKAALSQERVNINVIPEVYLPRPLPITQIVSWLFIVVAIAILIPLAVSAQSQLSKTSALQSQVNNAEAQVQAGQGTQASLEKLQAQIKEAKAARDLFRLPVDAAVAQRAKVNGDLKTVTRLLPGIINLKSISYSQGLTVAGTAPADITILNYARALRDSGQFTELTISDMVEMKYNEWNFTLILK